MNNISEMEMRRVVMSQFLSNFHFYSLENTFLDLIDIYYFLIDS